MGPSAVIVGHIRAKGAFQVAFVEDDHMVKAFTADGADEPLDVGRLPG